MIPVLATILIGASACSSIQVRNPSFTELEKHIVSSGAQQVVIPHTVDQEMLDWLRENVPQQGSDSVRLGVLAERLLADDGLGVTYSRDTTGTAREVFDTGAANCLAFTNLYVGLARSLGIDVRFLEVRDVENFMREDDLIVHSDHIAVGFGPRHQMTIIDFATEPGFKYRRISTLTDIEAIALYYSNRGTELLRDDQLESAHQWLQDAVRIAPNLSAAWVNLGVAKRRLGQEDLAEQAYRQALVINPTEYSAYQNLAALLQRHGRATEAEELLKLGGVARNRNPYAFLALGDLSGNNGRWQEAEQFYRRALRTLKGNAEPLAAMGTVAVQLGDLKAAERWLRKARKIDPEDARVVSLGLQIRAHRSNSSDRG